MFCVTSSNKRHSKATAEEPSVKWGIGLKQAQATLKVSVQLMTRSASRPLSRRHRTDHLMLQTWCLHCSLCTDAMLAKTKSSLQNLHVQIFACDNFACVKPVVGKSSTEIAKAFKQLVQDVGACAEIVAD